MGEEHPLGNPGATADVHVLGPRLIDGAGGLSPQPHHGLEREDLNSLREPVSVRLEVWILHVDDTLDLRALARVKDVFQLW